MHRFGMATIALVLGLANLHADAQTGTYTLQLKGGASATIAVDGKPPRLDVSVPTLMRMEKGDPSVSMAVYATALWVIGRHDALGVVAAPRDDVAALESDIAAAAQRHRRHELAHE